MWTECCVGSSGRHCMLYRLAITSFLCLQLCFVYSYVLFPLESYAHPSLFFCSFPSSGCCLREHELNTKHAFVTWLSLSLSSGSVPFMFSCPTSLPKSQNYTTVCIFLSGRRGCLESSWEISAELWPRRYLSDCYLGLEELKFMPSVSLEYRLIGKHQAILLRRRKFSN